MYVHSWVFYLQSYVEVNNGQVGVTFQREMGIMLNVKKNPKKQTQ